MVVRLIGSLNGRKAVNGYLDFALHFAGGCTLRVIRLIGSVNGRKPVNGYR